MIKSLIFFYESHGLTPLENFDFVDFFKTSFSGLESILISPEYHNTILSGLFCPKNTDDKKFDFLTKTMH